MNGPRVALAVLRKDLLVDLRSRDRLGHMLIFAALVVVLISIVLRTSAADARGALLPLLWIAFLFTSLLGLARSFQAETEDGAWTNLILVPVDRGWVFLGKAGANLLALLVVEAWTALLAVIFLDVDWTRAPGAALLAGVLGAIGLSTLGTLLSALSASARFREFLLPILLFPLILPVLVFAADITGEAIAGRALAERSAGALALYDWVFLLIGYLGFDSLVEA
ncbi:MAG: heme exporter protein CcmB [Myxococcales bacterium]|nr:heme exporter protein CcmB [Myxococcales bacterium]